VALRSSTQRCRFPERILAHVKTFGGADGTAQPRLRLSRPAPPLLCALKLNPVEPRRYATRMPGGCGRGDAARRPPILSRSMPGRHQSEHPVAITRCAQDRLAADRRNVIDRNIILG
jgi:hypothetical protein